jgi:hypothetical protein
MLFVRVSNAFCPGLGPAGTPSSDRGTVGSSLMLFISGLMLFVRGLNLFVRSSDPMKSHQVIVAQDFDAVGMIFTFIIQVSYPTLRVGVG